MTSGDCVEDGCALQGVREVASSGRGEVAWRLVGIENGAMRVGEEPQRKRQKHTTSGVRLTLVLCFCRVLWSWQLVIYKMPSMRAAAVELVQPAEKVCGQPRAAEPVRAASCPRG
eukprot:2193335-Rhodomonas_salina.1